MTALLHRSEGASRAAPARYVFPPALVPVLREQREFSEACLSEVSDELLVELLTTVFFAGLETHEGDRNPVRVVLVGTNASDLVIPDGDSGALTYRWNISRFESPRPFAATELVKLSVASADERIYTATQVTSDHLAIVGLAREGTSTEHDPFVKVVVSRPGGLSIRSGRNRLLEYEHGAILTGGEDVVFSAGPVRHALEATAAAAGLDRDTVPDYLDAVRALVREMESHGRGGILIINAEENPRVGASATYRMVANSALAPLLRLSRLIGRKDAHVPVRVVPNEPATRSESVAFRHLLHDSFLTEAERIIEEFGVLTGIDGATVLNRSLALVAFGVVLPVRQHTEVMQALDMEGDQVLPVDLGSRGTRHRASATYALDHPGSVVFVASEDGHVACMFRHPSRDHVLMWRLGPADVRIV